ncbi:MAG: hypothetical protein IPH64_03745 [Comamonadaceae bacterium]|nr:hypothetical protein [Comamonadaceae bacterium]
MQKHWFKHQLNSPRTPKPSATENGGASVPPLWTPGIITTTGTAWADRVRHPHILTQTFSQQPVDASQPAIDEALLDITLYRNFAVVTHIERFAYWVTTLRFRHLLEKPKLAKSCPQGNDRKRARDILYQIKHGITV